MNKSCILFLTVLVCLVALTMAFPKPQSESEDFDTPAEDQSNAEDDEKTRAFILFNRRRPEVIIERPQVEIISGGGPDVEFIGGGCCSFYRPHFNHFGFRRFRG